MSDLQQIFVETLKRELDKQGAWSGELNLTIIAAALQIALGGYQVANNLGWQKKKVSEGENKP